MAWPKLLAESKKVEELTTEVNLLRTDVTSLTNVITKAVIPNVLTAVDSLDGVVAATDATMEGLQSAPAIDQSLQGATGGAAERRLQRLQKSS